MFDVNKELLAFYKDGLSQILNGVILRDKTISRAGKSSAVIFVPSYLLGQKVKVIIIPENTEVAGLRKTIDKKSKALHKIREQLKVHNADLLEVEGESKSEPDVDDSQYDEKQRVKTATLEESDDY